LRVPWAYFIAARCARTADRKIPFVWVSPASGLL